MRRRLGAILVATSVIAASCGGDSAAPGPDAEWRRQLGSSEADTSFGVAAAPNGDIVLAATTEGDLGGAVAAERDIVIIAYTAAGDERWRVHRGSDANDSPLGIDVAENGTIYAAGVTEGSLGGPHQGSADVWLMQVSPEGEVAWTVQFGGPEWDRGFDVSAHDDGAYVTGYTSGVLDAETDRDGFDGFVAHFDTDGNERWIRQIGTDGTDWGQGSAADDDGVYVTGYTDSAFAGATAAGNKDAWVARLSADGTVEWIRQFGTPALDWTQGVGIRPDGGVVVAGATEGPLGDNLAGNEAFGARDAVIAAFTRSGEPEWITQIGTTETDGAFEVRVADGVIVASGASGGDLGTPLGDRDALLYRLDLDGTVLSTEQFGSAAIDETTGLDTLPNGWIVFSGYTSGAALGPTAGSTDVLIGVAPASGPLAPDQ